MSAVRETTPYASRTGPCDRTMVSGAPGTDGLGGSQQLAQARRRRGHRPSAVADAILLGLGQLGRGQAVGQQEDRVVAESAGPARLVGDLALDDAGEDLDRRLRRAGDGDGERRRPSAPGGRRRPASASSRLAGLVGAAPARAADARAPSSSAATSMPESSATVSRPEARAYATALAAAFSAYVSCGSSTSRSRPSSSGVTTSAGRCASRRRNSACLPRVGGRDEEAASLARRRVDRRALEREELADAGGGEVDHLVHLRRG